MRAWWQSFALITVMKLVLLVGMTLMHTRIRFKLQFFEFEDAKNDPSSQYDSSPGGFGSSPGGYIDAGSPSPMAGTPPRDKAIAL